MAAVREDANKRGGTKRRILLGALSFGESFSGAALSATLVARMLESEFDVSVVTGANGSSHGKVHELRLGPLRAAVPMLLRLPMRAAGITHQVEKVIREVGPELVHLQDADLVDPVVPVARRLGVPVIVTLRDARYASRMEPGRGNGNGEPAKWVRARSFLDLVQLRRPISWPLPLLLPWLYAKPTRVQALLAEANLLLPVSRFLKEELQRCGIAAPSRVLKLLPVPEWPELSLRKGPSRKFLFIGRLVRGKGAQVLIKGFRRVLERLPDAELVIAGDGPEQRNLEKLAGRLGCKSRIRFLGYVPYHDVFLLYEETDIVVFPSVLPEALGRVLVEATMLGRPVIASRVGGVPEIIGPENGILCEPGNADELAKQMIALATDPERQRELVQGGKERAVAYSFAHLRAELKEIYEQVLRGETPAE
jgi:glycosyltransferase involved in cell wall biosynthesis